MEYLTQNNKVIIEKYCNFLHANEILRLQKLNQISKIQNLSKISFQLINLEKSAFRTFRMQFLSNECH